MALLTFNGGCEREVARSREVTPGQRHNQFTRPPWGSHAGPKFTVMDSPCINNWSGADVAAAIHHHDDRGSMMSGRRGGGLDLKYVCICIIYRAFTKSPETVETLAQKYWEFSKFKSGQYN